jgi:hypothetical protein
MSLGAFFGVVSTVDFALLGLWWVTVQTRPDLRKNGSSAARMAYVVSLQFIVPGTAGLLAQVDPAETLVWRVSFAIAGVTGILAILILVPELAASGALSVAKFLRFGALPLYAVMTFIAVTPGLLSNKSGKIAALQVEGILFCLVVFLSAQVAWAAAMSTVNPAEHPEQAAPVPGNPVPGNEPGRLPPPPPVPASGPTDAPTVPGIPHYGYQPPPGAWGRGPYPDPRYPERGNPAGKPL